MALTPAEIAQRIWTSYQILDREICAQKTHTSGCSTITTVCSDGNLITAQLGDSSAFAAIYNKNGEAISVVRLNSMIHKPNERPERNRIIEAGGIVRNNHVQGNSPGGLAVSRAIGDRQYKSRGVNADATIDITSIDKIKADLVKNNPLIKLEDIGSIVVITTNSEFTDAAPGQNASGQNKKAHENYLLSLLQIANKPEETMTEEERSQHHRKIAEMADVVKHISTQDITEQPDLEIINKSFDHNGSEAGNHVRTNVMQVIRNQLGLSPEAYAGQELSANKNSAIYNRDNEKFPIGNVNNVAVAPPAVAAPLAVAAPSSYKNEDFFDILKDGAMLSEQFVRDHNPQEALDAFLRINLTAADVDDQINNIVRQYKSVWTALFEDSDGNVIPDGEHIVSKDGNPNYKTLLQAAAEQRVKLGLKKADEEVLIKILKNNSDECRDYLATRNELAALATIPGWIPSAPAIVAGAAPAVVPVAGIDILTAASINEIQKQAFAQLLIQRALKPGVSQDAVLDLLLADDEEIKNVARQLGVPDEILNKPGLQFPLPMEEAKQMIAINYYKANEEDLVASSTMGDELALGKESFQDRLEIRHNLSKAGGVTLFRDYISESFSALSSKYLLHTLNIGAIARLSILDPANIKDLLLTAIDGSDNELAANISPILGADSEDLPEYIQVGVEDLDPVKLRNTLLQRFLSNINTDPKMGPVSVGINDFYSITQAKNPGELKTGLGLLGLNKDKLDWINDTTLDIAKEWAREKSHNATDRHIANVMPEKLSDLKKIILIKNDKAGFEEFKKQIQALGFSPVDWQPGDMSNLKQLCRNRAFEIEINQHFMSKFGAEAHGYLLDLLGKLPEKKQNEFLEHPDQLTLLLGAQDESALRHFLGRGNPALDKDDYEDLIVENKKVAACKRIQNSALSNMLVVVEAELNDQQIHAINQVLKDFKNLNNPAEYIKFIKEIAEISNLEKEEFFDQIGIKIKDEDDTLILLPKAEQHKNDIIAQRKHNNSLYEYITAIAPHGISTRYKVDLATILLRVDKNASLDIATQIEVLEEKFKNASTLEGFLKSIVGKPPAEPWVTVQKGLTKEFTHTLFDVIKIKESVSDLNDFSSKESFGAGIKKIRNKLDLINKDVATPAEYAKEFEFIDGINTEHLADPAFLDRARVNIERQITNHEEIFKACDLMIDRLLRHKNELETYFNQNIRIEDPTRAREKFEQIRDIDRQLKKVRDELAIYKNRQAKLSKIFEDVDIAANNRKEYVYKPSNFQVVERGEASITTSAATQPVVSQAAATQPPAVNVNIINYNVRANYNLEDRLTPGQARDFKYTRVENPGAGQRSTVTGTFTETCPQITAPVTYNSDSDRVTRVEARQFTVREPLKQNGPKTEMEDKNVEFYLKMAVTIISRLKGKPPTADNPIQIDGASAEDMRHIWTALVVLAEKNSKINFGPEAIRVMPGRDFNPENEKGFFGFKSNSLYKVYTKDDYADLIKDTVQHVENLESARAAHTGAVDAMDQGINRYKQRVTKDREAAAKESSPEKTRLDKEMKWLNDITPISEEHVAQINAKKVEINNALKKLAESRTEVGKAKDQRDKAGPTLDLPDDGYKI